MNYEVIELHEKRVAGIRIRTQNHDPEMKSKIGAAWKRFFESGIYQSIPGKMNDKSLGLYTNYENSIEGEYDVVVCCEVESLENLPTSLQTEIVPAGKYAKFIVSGHIQNAIEDFWIKLWSIDLDRRFGCDFEEYQNNGDADFDDIHVYISIH